MRRPLTLPTMILYPNRSDPALWFENSLYNGADIAKEEDLFCAN